MSFQLFTIKETHLVVNTDQVISVYQDLKTRSTVILCREGNKYVVDEDISIVLNKFGIRVPEPKSKIADLSAGA
jgi:hypothetical protein